MGRVLVTFPDLPAGVDVIRQPPDATLLAAFCACADHGCRPVATVTGPDGIDLAGLSCLRRLVNGQLARTDPEDESPVTVEVPCWNTDALADLLGVRPLRVDGWARLGFLTAVEPLRSTSSFNYFLATEVSHAVRLLAAARARVHLSAAHELLCGSDADRRLLAAFVARLAQPEKEEAA